MALEPRLRLAVAACLLMLVAGGLVWVVQQAPSGSSEVGSFRVVVMGPGGDALADGFVESRATPFHALQALARAANVTVEVEQQPWIGPGCTAEYVIGIAGIRETATGGWNYYVRPVGGVWTWQWAGAACHALTPGDEVEWCWVEDDVCRHHAA
jgi:hypothetical protein